MPGLGGATARALCLLSLPLPLPQPPTSPQSSYVLFIMEAASGPPVLRKCLPHPIAADPLGSGLHSQALARATASDPDDSYLTLSPSFPSTYLSTLVNRLPWCLQVALLHSWLRASALSARNTLPQVCKELLTFFPLVSTQIRSIGEPPCPRSPDMKPKFIIHHLRIPSIYPALVFFWHQSACAEYLPGC